MAANMIIMIAAVSCALIFACPTISIPFTVLTAWDKFVGGIGTRLKLVVVVIVFTIFYCGIVSVSDIWHQALGGSLASTMEKVSPIISALAMTFFFMVPLLFPNKSRENNGLPQEKEGAAKKGAAKKGAAKKGAAKKGADKTKVQN